MRSMFSEVLEEGSPFAVDKCLFDGDQQCIKPHHIACDNCPVVRNIRLRTLLEKRANPGCESVLHVPIPPRQLTRKRRKAIATSV